MKSLLKYFNPLNWFKKTTEANANLANIESIVLEIKNFSPENYRTTIFNETMRHCVTNALTDTNYYTICRQFLSGVKFNVKEIHITSNIEYKEDEYVYVSFIKRNIIGHLWQLPICLNLAKGQENKKNISSEAIGKKIDFTLDATTEVQITLKPYEEIIIGFIGKIK